MRDYSGFIAASYAITALVFAWMIGSSLWAARKARREAERAGK